MMEPHTVSSSGFPVSARRAPQRNPVAMKTLATLLILATLSACAPQPQDPPGRYQFISEHGTAVVMFDTHTGTLYGADLKTGQTLWKPLVSAP